MERDISSSDTGAVAAGGWGFYKLAAVGLAGKVVVVNGSDPELNAAITAAMKAQWRSPLFTLGLDVLYSHMVPTSDRAAGLNGPRADAHMRGLHAAVSGAARSGADVLVDHTLAKQSWYEELVNYTTCLDVTWVRIAGGTEVHELCDGIEYDLTVDTKGDPPEAIAARILIHLETRRMRGRPYARVVTRRLPHRAERPGWIAILVGTSSAGKSTICRAVQAHSKELVLELGIDEICLAVAPVGTYSVPSTLAELESWRPTKIGKAGFTMVPPGPNEDNPTEYIQQQVGWIGRLTISALMGAIASMSAAGIAVVTDQIFIYEDWYDELEELVEGLPATWISVNPDPAVLWEHERKRGDRFPGHAAGQLAQMYKEIDFDLVIDSGRMTPEQEAEAVLGAVKS